MKTINVTGVGEGGHGVKAMSQIDENTAKNSRAYLPNGAAATVQLEQESIRQYSRMHVQENHDNVNFVQIN